MDVDCTTCGASQDVAVKDISMGVVTVDEEEKNLLLTVLEHLRNGGCIELRSNRSECLRKGQKYTKCGMKVDEIC